MSHIVEFSVTGLAGREGTVSARLDRHVNIFFGYNGSGKTSLLKILDSALSQDASLLSTTPFRAASVTLFSESAKKEYTYSLERKSSLPDRKDSIQISEGGVTRSVSEERWTIKPTPRNKGAWRHAFLPTSRLFFGSDESYTYSYSGVVFGRGAQSLEETLNDRFKSAIDREWVAYYSTLQTQIRETQQRGLADIVKEVLGIGSTAAAQQAYVAWEAAYERMTSFIRRQDPEAQPGSKATLERRFYEERPFRNVLSHINRVEEEIEKSSLPLTTLERLVQRLFANKHVRFEPTGISIESTAKQTIGLGSLSSGEKHLLRILIPVLQVDRSSFIVDEPEISMHVDWQREFVRTVHQLNPKAQVVLATHSPEIMAEVEDERIFRI